MQHGAWVDQAVHARVSDLNLDPTVCPSKASRDGYVLAVASGTP